MRLTELCLTGAPATLDRAGQPSAPRTLASSARDMSSITTVGPVSVHPDWRHRYADGRVTSHEQTVRGQVFTQRRVGLLGRFASIGRNMAEGPRVSPTRRASG